MKIGLIDHSSDKIGRKYEVIYGHEVGEILKYKLKSNQIDWPFFVWGGQSEGVVGVCRVIQGYFLYL